ncbi:hypothetical protein OK016_27620 [Vibrio chagasii]|nr:hypothetical protein [Vibrio chagasii]
MHGTFYVAGMCTRKLKLQTKIWLNNPMYMGTISGSDTYKNGAFYDDDSITDS